MTAGSPDQQQAMRAALARDGARSLLEPAPVRLVADLPIDVRRSGLTLLLITRPGMASALSQAIDESTFQHQEGTLAGENTVLVLFADGERLERWLATFEGLRGRPTGSRGPTEHAPTTLRRPS